MSASASSLRVTAATCTTNVGTVAAVAADVWLSYGAGVPVAVGCTAAVLVGVADPVAAALLSGAVTFAICGQSGPVWQSGGGAGATCDGEGLVPPATVSVGGIACNVGSPGEAVARPKLNPKPKNRPHTITSKKKTPSSLPVPSVISVS